MGQRLAKKYDSIYMTEFDFVKSKNALQLTIQYFLPNALFVFQPS